MRCTAPTRGRVSGQKNDIPGGLCRSLFAGRPTTACGGARTPELSFSGRGASRPHAVRNEWQSKYWDEILEGCVMVLPVLFQKCEVLMLLKAKKYADFTEDYNKGLENLLLALKDES
jgi:hypothetical protein